MTNKKYFNGIKQGDEVWSTEFGEGKVITLHRDIEMCVNFSENGSKLYWFDFYGKKTSEGENAPQTLFWSRNTFIKEQENKILEILENIENDNPDDELKLQIKKIKNIFYSIIQLRN